MKLQYAVVFERTPNNYCAYVPDLPGCIGTDRTWEGIQDQIRDAIAFHIEGLREDGETVPEPRMSVADAAAYHSDSAVPSAEWLETSELVAVVAVEAELGAAPAVATDR
ncbi:Uncharacterized 14.9 kDa protein in rep-hol intergenic region [Geodia barretti]|uniref:Uncharacterized 14.9 kDa protein in rep-hol intergenic region n=1 Tax=Geodia barretti TaxID=519541 RepID=A0AA35R6V0_GEOBA|nr:Uncharacterized 14.9 kDa protein in rep-hol intergenic region [Geodia barretti]